MLFFGEVVDLGDSLVDGLDDVGENGVFLVVHASVGDTFEGEFEDVLLDFLLVVLVGGVDTL